MYINKKKFIGFTALLLIIGVLRQYLILLNIIKRVLPVR